MPLALYWAIVTISTVGYGDTCPITAWGKFYTMCLAVVGIILFALPAGIISSGLVEVRIVRE